MAKKKITTDTDGAITAYKAFDRNFQCRGFQYEVGKTYTHEGTVRACGAGFHSCEDPLDTLSYYDICDGTRFAIVKASGEISRETNGDSKLASAVIHIEAELSYPDFIGRTIQWIKDACKVTPDGAETSGDYAKNASSGHYATNASSGHYATNASSGDYATNASSGDSAKNASSGDYAKNASSGDYATNASSGHSAKNASSGHSATNASSGDYATNASSGDSATNASSGDYATNASSGDYAYNEATGEHAVITGAGRGTYYKGAKGVWISAAEYADVDGKWRCIGFAVGQAGYDGVPTDTWLIAKGGKLVPA